MFRKIFHFFVVIITVLTLMTFTTGILNSEGVSILSSITTTSSVENIGKTYSITVNMTPNTLFYMSAFDMVVNFDSANVTPVIESGKVKITKSSKMPSGFEIEASVSGSSIIILGIDNTQENPFKLSGASAICTLYFTVKSTATVGKQISYSTSEGSVTDDKNEGITLDNSNPKTVTIGKKLDTNAYLKSISTDTGILSPEFAQKTMKYFVEVGESVSAIAITATPEASTSKVIITGGKNLEPGVNTVNIKVTAEDSGFSKTYVIIVTRLSPSSMSNSSEITSEEESLIVSSEEASSEASSSELESDVLENSSEPSDVLSDSDIPWKTFAYIFAGTSFVFMLATAWLIVDKISNKDKIIKSRRV